MPITYKGLELKKGSKALELYLISKKTGKPEDKKALDQHMKDVETRHTELLKRYK